jgi:transposase-like protein
MGPRESYDAWLSFLQDVVARGLRDPLLVVMDGAPGLVKAVKRVWPRAYRQRCLAHKMRNIIAKLPRLMQAKIKGLVHQVFGAPTYAAALKRGRDLIAKFKDRYPAAMECLERDLEECVTYLRFPDAHHHRIRTTNRLERLNGESRRQHKGDSTLSDGTIVSLVALRKSDHGFEALARYSDVGGGREAPAAAPRYDHRPDQG